MKRACPCSTPFRMVAQMHLERLPGYAPELNRNLDDAKGDEDCTASVRISEATAEGFSGDLSDSDKTGQQPFQRLA